MTEKVQTMEEQLFDTIEGLRGEGVDFTQQPVVFKWRYDRNKDFHFTLVIEEFDENEEELIVYDLPTKEDTIH